MLSRVSTSRDCKHFLAPPCDNSSAMSGKGLNMDVGRPELACWVATHIPSHAGTCAVYKIPLVKLLHHTWLESQADEVYVIAVPNATRWLRNC